MQYEKIIILTPADLLPGFIPDFSKIDWTYFRMPAMSQDIYNHADTILFLDGNSYKFIKNKYAGKYVDVQPQPDKALPVGEAPESNLKPFDLSAALAGKPVVTRDGRPVKIAGHNPKAAEGSEIAGWIDGIVRNWSESGVYHSPNSHPVKEESVNLFIAPTQREVWVNLYNAGSTFFFEEDRAERSHGETTYGNRLGGKAHKIIIEE